MAGTSTMKIRATAKDGEVLVKALIKHPMETGLRKDPKTGEKIPAHYVQELTATWKDKVVLKAFWGTGVSRNPYISFKFKGGQAGDDLTLNWVDNTGAEDRKTVKIK